MTMFRPSLIENQHKNSNALLFYGRVYGIYSIQNKKLSLTVRHSWILLYVTSPFLVFFFCCCEYYRLLYSLIHAVIHKVIHKVIHQHSCWFTHSPSVSVHLFTLEMAAKYDLLFPTQIFALSIIHALTSLYNYNCLERVHNPNPTLLTMQVF